MSRRSVPSSGPKTLASLARLYRYAKLTMPRIYVAMVASLAASLMALAIPQVLQWLIDGPLTGDDVGLVWLSVGIVLALGVAEAYHRRASLARADTGHARRGAHAQQSLPTVAATTRRVP